MPCLESVSQAPPSLVEVTYGLAGNHHAIRRGCLHRWLLLRWVDFRHLRQLDDKIYNNGDFLTDNLGRSTLVESLRKQMTRGSIAMSMSFFISSAV